MTRRNCERCSAEGRRPCSTRKLLYRKSSSQSRKNCLGWTVWQEASWECWSDCQVAEDLGAAAACHEDVECARADVSLNVLCNRSALHNQPPHIRSSARDGPNQI